MGKQILSKSITFNSREGSETTNGTVRIGMEEGDEITSKRLWFLLCWPWHIDRSHQRETCVAAALGWWEVMSEVDEVLVHCVGIQLEEQCFRLGAQAVGSDATFLLERDEASSPRARIPTGVPEGQCDHGEAREQVNGNETGVVEGIRIGALVERPKRGRRSLDHVGDSHSPPGHSGGEGERLLVSSIPHPVGEDDGRLRVAGVDLTAFNSLARKVLSRFLGKARAAKHLHEAGKGLTSLSRVRS